MFPVQPEPDEDDITPEELQALLDRLAAQQRDILAAVTAPKRVVRDASGRVIGVETL